MKVNRISKGYYKVISNNGIELELFKDSNNNWSFDSINPKDTNYILDNTDTYYSKKEALESLSINRAFNNAF